MNIIIVGGGMVGKNLVQQLSEDGNNITVIDLEEDNINAITTKYDVNGIVGNGATHRIQQEAGIEDADLLIAVTGSDELNLLCCIIAKKEGKCQTIARVETPVYRADADYLKEQLGLAMVISPEYVAAKEISRLLRFPSAIKIETFANGNVELLKFRLPEGSKLAGMSVKEVVTKLKCDVLICTIERDSDTYIAYGDFVFKDKDIISIIASHKNADEFTKKVGFETHSAKNVMLAGGGEITHYLCEMLPKHGMNVKVIEKDRHICEEMCSDFGKISIINADTSDIDILIEEGVRDTDAFVSLLDLDEENILLSLTMKNLSKGKIITEIKKADFDAIAKNLDLDTTVNPKTITSDMIVRYVRATQNTLGSNVETLYNFIPGKATAAEFIVKENSPIASIPISELKLKKNILISSIIRNGHVILPRGNDVIIPGDSVVIVSEFMPLHDISDVLK
ncbi:MAG: Trk system potassium transporter TrkA [Clostridia bacterium]|nr:Trk system potassium transporter TrkA [Clostridia bacterium]